jgi:hypothetical protein
MELVEQGFMIVVKLRHRDVELLMMLLVNVVQIVGQKHEN